MAQKFSSIYLSRTKSIKIPLNPISPLLCACLLFPILETEINAQYLSQGITPHIGEAMMLTSEVIHAVVSASFSHFPRRISSSTSYIMATQFRLTPFSGKRHPRPKLLRMKEFNLALKFLKVRALVNEQLFDAYNFWQHLHRQQERHGEHRHGHHHPPPHHKPSKAESNNTVNAQPSPKASYSVLRSPNTVEIHHLGPGIDQGPLPNADLLSASR